MNNYSNSNSGSSPFRYYPNEQLEEVRTCIPNQIRLSELDQLVLGVINRVLLVTSLLLHRYLEEAGLKNTTVDDVRGCLRRLSDNGYLTRLRFHTPDGRSNLQIFTLAELGREEIRCRGRNTLRLGYLERMDSIHAKRQLAALQFVIGQGYVPEATHTAFGRLVREMDDSTGNHLFRPQAVVQTKEKTVFVEAVRQNRGAADDLVRKLKRINGTLGSGGALNLMGSGSYEVVIVAESYQHMTFLMEELEGRLREKLCFRLYFTNDQDTFRQNGKLYTLPEKQSFGYNLTGKLARLFGI